MALARNSRLFQSRIDEALRIFARARVPVATKQIERAMMISERHTRRVISALVRAGLVRPLPGRGNGRRGVEYERAA